MYIDEYLNYTVIEKASENAFQALWIEIQFPKQANVICGVVYRQHNSPERFLEYFDQTLEKLSASGKSIYIIGNFNVNLLRAESCKYSHKFLISLQSYSFIPTIDKPMRVYRNSATLIDNILVKNVKGTVSSGNVVSNVSDHLTQFCIFHSCKNKISPPRQKIRDYSRFSKSIFHNELSQIEWDSITTDNQNDIDRTFSNFFNTLNKLVNKHAPLKPVSKRQAHRFMKPWITKGLRKSIKIKNALFYSGDIEKYKYYRNKLLTLSRLSKKLYYSAYFSDNITNMQKTWAGINSLINHHGHWSNSITSPNGELTHNPFEIPRKHLKQLLYICWS